MTKQNLLLFVLFLIGMLQGAKAQLAYAVLSDDGKTVTFYYDTEKFSRTGVMDINQSIVDVQYGPSNAYGTATTAIFDASFADYRPISTAFWFWGCTKLTSISGMEFLNTDSVKDMSYMFRDCSSLASLDVGNFNTANVTNIRGMFEDCSSLTSLDLSNFNTDNVTDMYYIFSGCSSLTSLDVSNFNISKVKHLRNIFSGCSSLTSLDVSNFNTENVTNMSSMFSGCSSLASLDTSHFNTINVTRMGSMFSGCSSLTSLDVNNFNTSKVTDVSSMFSGCSSLTTLDVSNFKTDMVTNMSSMFSGCSSLTTLDVSNFNTEKVTNMSSMFSGCSSLASLDISHFNTINVTRMGSMFSGCSSLTSLDVSIFNTSKVTNMSSIFSDCGSLTTLDVSNFNTNKVTSMNSMFSGCSSLTSLDLCNFNTYNVTDMSSMFYDCVKLKTIFANEGWNTKAVKLSTDMFHNCIVLSGSSGTAYDANHTDVEYALIDGGRTGSGYLTDKSVSPVVNAEAYAVLSSDGHTVTFYYDTDKDNRIGLVKIYQKRIGQINAYVTATTAIIDPSFADYHPISTAFWFSGCTDLTSIFGIEYLCTSNTTDMRCMFSGCSSLTSLDIRNFNTSKVKNMYQMFKGCVSLETIYVSEEWTTDAVTNGSAMFENCTALVGGAGTAYDTNHTDAAYARIDGGTDAPGYFTGKNVPVDNVTLTAKNYTREYGEENPVFEYEVTEGTITSGTPEITCEATASSPVGTYDIIISKGTVSNNGTVELVKGTLTITKAPLIISVESSTKEEGEDNPEFTLTYNGFKNGETEDVLSKQPTITTTATKESSAGEYDVKVSGAEAQNYSISYRRGTLTITAKPIEIVPVEEETKMNTEDLGGQDLSDNVVNDVYYNVGDGGYDATDQSIVISQTTNMGQIADKEPGSKDVRDNFNGIILKVAKGKGLITVNVKTSGNAQLVVQVGNGTPMLASKTEKGDVVFSYDVEEDTYVYIYAIIGSSAAKSFGINATDTDSSVRIYGITVSPGATGIRSIGSSEKNDDIIYDLQGRRVKNTAKGVYIVGGRKYSVK